ncbi:PRC-barrel domain containing protein [Trinickia sp. EG282A]|uniref:PRC-barrel domain containing protein n=1 Tax=Trinickia sp. EG282A TaxID=3237013 RepID=UPI0034D22832
MSGGVPRQHVIRWILAWILLSVLAGCSTWFAPKPPPVTEQPAPSPEPETESPPEAASEASAPEPANPPSTHAEAPETHKAPPRPVHRRPPPHRAPPAETPPPPAPVAPTPIVTTRLLSSNDTRSLLDARVQRPDGKVIGRAIDMFVDKEGKPIEMLVNLSGFMGIGDRKIRFPWSAFTFNMAPKKTAITLDVPHGQPPAAEALKKHGPASASAAHDDAPLLRLIDATVERGDGSRVGRVTDVLIDNHAAPQAAVLDVGSLIHQRRRIVADWSALRFVRKNKDDGLTVQADLSDAQVEAAPSYEPDQPVRAISPAPPPAKPAATSTASSR